MPSYGSKDSLQELNTNFLATMVEARFLLEHLENSFCTEIWPAIFATLSKSAHGDLEISDLQQRNAELQAHLEGQMASFTTSAADMESSLVKPMDVQKIALTQVPKLPQKKGCPSLKKTKSQCVPSGSGSVKVVRPTLVDVSNTLKNDVDQGWRQTRSAPARGGNISHDEFLDTPRDLIFAKLAATDVEQCEPCVGFGVKEASKFAAFMSELDKREGFRSTRGPIQAMEKENYKPATKKIPAFKYNEPVRYKREREDLVGTDCKLCRKFYDAVEQGDARIVDMSRCEHLQVASRHRFQHLPLDTPLGFWDLGFPDSGKEAC